MDVFASQMTNLWHSSYFIFWIGIDTIQTSLGSSLKVDQQKCQDHHIFINHTATSYWVISGIKGWWGHPVISQVWRHTFSPRGWGLSCPVSSLIWGLENCWYTLQYIPCCILFYTHWRTAMPQWVATQPVSFPPTINISPFRSAKPRAELTGARSETCWYCHCAGMSYTHRVLTMFKSDVNWWSKWHLFIHWLHRDIHLGLAYLGTMHFLCL